MLKFQEGFFEQEVRNGFYIDVTMKTVWAAELEVLQKVAEICDRHGIVWYAAYGTLLGAIRHEGFVPWDDDMDIWVKRKDYNRLLKILPTELPQGYKVRNCMTEETYTQLHTCINSGDKISMDREWLEQYHGCPFTVALDIFPLDYLPRDESTRKMQENLFSVASHSALLAGALQDNEDNEIKGMAEVRSVTRKEVEGGIQYLEETCGMKMDHQLIEDENWEQVGVELWRWANYIAMMYGEDESDYLVQYMDYVSGKWRIYRKEWFEEVYSADFENFMLPVPCGYDEILTALYGPYRVQKKKTGSHEYPYYARQLCWLKELVLEKEKEAEELDIFLPEDIRLFNRDVSLPLEWENIIKKIDGQRKKIVLFANDLASFCKHGDKALDKLDEVLKVFEDVKEQVALWWRPSRFMLDELNNISQTLARRYQVILDNYKKQEWGICDETDNVDRAVEMCDIYYGDMNAVVQPFQNTGKPIMLAVTVTEER